MPSILVAWPTAGANSYVSQTDATTYFQGAIHAGAWATATNAQKDQALVTATRILDRMHWTGTRTSTSQDLAFPRSGITDRHGVSVSSAAIPGDITTATYELALALIENSNIAGGGGASASNVKSLTTSRTSVEFFNASKPKAGGMPDSVFQLVSYMLASRNLNVAGASYGTDSSEETGTPSQFEARNKFDKTEPFG